MLYYLVIRVEPTVEIPAIPVCFQYNDKVEEFKLKFYQLELKTHRHIENIEILDQFNISGF